MDWGLTGKVALVTGSSRGISRGVALQLAAEGCDVMLTGRDEAALNEVVAAVKKLGRSAQKLIAIAPRLRARGAGAVIKTLLDEDAVLASARRGAISDRGARRLFDRLVALGGVRELTGRATFRLYGL